RQTSRQARAHDLTSVKRLLWQVRRRKSRSPGALAAVIVSGRRVGFPLKRASARRSPERDFPITTNVHPAVVTSPRPNFFLTSVLTRLLAEQIIKRFAVSGLMPILRLTLFLSIP